MMTSTIWLLAVPVIMLVYAAKLYIGRPSYNDSFGFPTRRARESEEIWDYVQRCAGAVCFFEAIFLGISSYLCLIVFKHISALYWAAIALDALCLFAIAPIVNDYTDKKFPPKKKKRK